MSVGGRIVDDLLAGKVVLVDVSGLGSTEEVLVASFLARRVLETWQAAYLDDPDRHRRMPVVSLALEEAQRVLSGSKDRESNVFPRVAREGRKFGVGLCAVTQQPKLLEDELLSQFNTFFILGLADEKDRNMLRSSAKQDISAQGPEIQTLMPGECLDRQPGRPLRHARHDRSLRRGGTSHSPAASTASGRGDQHLGSGGLRCQWRYSARKSPSPCRSSRSTSISAVTPAGSRPGCSNTAPLISSVACPARRRPAGVISAKVVRPSVGCGTRLISPPSSSRLTALVMLVGWT